MFPPPTQMMQPQAAPSVSPPAPAPIQQPTGSPAPKRKKQTFLAGAAQVPPPQTGGKTLLGQ